MTVARLLALDLGTNCGWAHRSEDGIVSSGTQPFKPHRFEGAGMRLLRFKRWLTEMKGGGLDAIYFEEIHSHGKFAGVATAHLYGAFSGILMAWCEAHEIPYSGIGVGTVKKFATGKGNADKRMMIQAARARGCAPADDNEADAFLLLHCAIDLHEGGISALTNASEPRDQRPALGDDSPPF